MAQSFHRNGAFLDPEGRSDWVRPPGYPWLLAALLAGETAAPDRLMGVVAFQALLSALVAGLAAFLTMRIAGPVRAYWVGFLLALEPSGIAYSFLIISETLYTFLLALALLAWWRWLGSPGWASIAVLALLLGALPLVRPIGLYLPALAALLVFLAAPPSRRLWASVVYLFLSFLPALGWVARNQSVMGVAAFNGTSAWALAIFARSAEDWVGRPVPEGTGAQPWETTFQADRARPLAESLRLQKLYFRDVLLQHPLAATARLALNGMQITGVPDSALAFLWHDDPPRFRGGRMAERLGWILRLGVLAPLVLLGMGVSLGGTLIVPRLVWLARRWAFRCRWTAIFIVAVVVYHLSLSSLVWKQGERYRVPLIPLLAIVLVLGTAGGPQARGAGLRLPCS